MELTLCAIFLATFTAFSDAQSTASPLVEFFRCDFENGDICNLQQSTNDDLNWTLHQGGTPTDYTGPTTDHTTGTSAGYYVYTEPPLPVQQGDVAILMSPNLASGNTRCLEFFYHMYGQNVGSLEVLSQNIDDGSASPQRLWMQSLNKGVDWQRGLITIPSTANNFQLIFKVTIGGSIQNDIALDDITFSQGLCPYDAVHCDFEDPLLCGYTFDDTADVRFVYGSGSTPSTFTGPSVDHTYNNISGHYMFLEASGVREGMTARLVSPMIAGSADGSNCLILWYHMYGEIVGTLAVFSKSSSTADLGSPLWFASGNKGNRWRAVEMHLTSVEDFQVIIEGTGTGNYKNDISFDDVMITGNICPGEYVFKNSSGVTCDFEATDLCYYKQDKTDTADWIWQNSATRDEFSGPDVDHTLGNDLGFYLVILGDQSSSGGEVARLISPTFEPTTASSCLEFWYHMYGDDVETLNVYVVAANYDKLPETPSWSQRGNQGNYWHRATFTFPTRSSDSRIVFEGQYGVRERDDVAIDDVVLYHSEPCPEFVTDPAPPTTRSPEVEDISCDFEQDFCDYVQDIDDLFDWSRHQGPTEAHGSGPDVDHTLGTALGFYALMDCNNQYLRFDDRTRLISPLLQASSSPRCLQFFYYKYSINVKTQDFLNVYIKRWGHRLSFDPDWSVFGVTYEPEWQEGKLELPPSDEPFQVVFEGSYGFYEYYCDIAIDDIQLQHSSCGTDPIDQDLVENVNCDFENTGDPFCGYVQGFPESDIEDKVDWYIGSGSTPSEGTGPDNDHTLGNSNGHYMYIEASQPQRPNDNAAVTSPRLKLSLDHMCLQFFYHMSGEDTGWLRVLVTADNEQTKEVARLSGQQEYGWRPMLVDIPSFRGTVRITFEGKIGNSYSGDIAVDDIMTVREPCGGFPDGTFCDFEVGFDSCRYDSLNTGTYKRWSWYDMYSGDGPVERGSGSYMFSSSTNKRVASITSNAFQMKSSSCLMFDYTIKGESCSLQVKNVSSSDTRDLDSLEKETGWTTYQITLTPSPDVTRIQFIATTTDSTVAVDNVIVLSGSCNDDRPTAEPVVGKSRTSTGIIIVIILIVLAVVVLAVVLVLFIRSRKGSSGLTFTYQNQSNEANLTSSTTLSDDPGIANPNYEPKSLTNSA